MAAIVAGFAAAFALARVLALTSVLFFVLLVALLILALVLRTEGSLQRRKQSRSLDRCCCLLVDFEVPSNAPTKVFRSIE